MEQQGWTPTYFDTYRSAVIDDGKQTLSVVTAHLYKGGSTRPDIYFKSKYGVEKYRNTFNFSQCLTLENCYEYFNIRTAVKDYDISLNYILQEHLCGLPAKGSHKWHVPGTFENMLNEVHKKRNEVSHQSWTMNESELKVELLELQKLFGDILHYVDRQTSRSIDSDRSSIMNSLKERFPDEENQDSCVGNHIMNRYRSNLQPTYASSSSRNDWRGHSLLAYRQREEESSDEEDEKSCYGNQIMNRLRSNVNPSSIGTSSMYGGRSNSASTHREKEEEKSCYGNQIMNRLRSNVHPSSIGPSSMYGGRSNSASTHRGKEEESSGLETFGKIALGVAGVAAAAAWGVSKLVEDNKSSEEEKKRKQRSSNEEDCSIM